MPQYFSKKPKAYIVEIRDWTGVSEIQVDDCYNHAEAVSFAREYCKLHGRQRGDGPITFRPRVKYRERDRW